MVRGWILRQNAKREIVNGLSIKEFILVSFDEWISKRTVSKYLTRVGINSHAAKIKDSKYLRDDLAPCLYKYTKTL